MVAKLNTLEGDRLDVLVTLDEAWEAKRRPLDLPTPASASPSLIMMAEDRAA